MASDTRIYTLADRLITCARERLANTRDGDVERACVITGAMAWDPSCLCGELIADITNFYPSSTFPTPAVNTGGLGKCGIPYVVYSVTFTMLRCVPGADEQGNAPDCDALAFSALGAVEDASAVYAGLQCCLDDLIRERTPVTGVPVLSGYQMSQQQFVGPAGQCGGSALTVLLGLPAMCCDED